jgi:2'-hydroxyisoflavone reductase
MNILILGGTKFLGRHLVEAALARGHRLTLFNRGSRSGLFEGVEELRGDRALGVEGLQALRGRQWDAVVDTSGYVPRLVAASAEVLRENVGRYVFISSISVYSDFAEAPDESSPVAQLADPNSEDIPRDYGALKAACEEVVKAAFGERALSIRPGLIVGPFDPTGRFTYWPRRIARGGDVLAPADPAADVQFIDARDLARWVVELIERKVGGVFNATGPAEAMTFGMFLDAAARALGVRCSFTWVEAEFLQAQGVQAWTELPLWVDDAPGLNRTHIARAIRAGLTFTPLEKTVNDTFAWAQAEARARGSESLGAAGLDAEKEAGVLAAWAAQRSR